MQRLAINCFIVILTINGLVECQRRCNAFSEWKCGNGQCIRFNAKCNGRKDCDDGSDETAKECITFRCPMADSQFRCAYGACVPKASECNGVRDCADNSDELTRKCTPDAEARLRGTCSNSRDYQCASGECISADNFCDGFADCPDKSDETVEKCASHCCSSAGFQCGYGGCIDGALICNGISDCVDGSDENYSLCNTPRNQAAPPLADTPPPYVESKIAARHDGTSGGSVEVVTVAPTSRPTPRPEFEFPTPESTDSCRITKIPRNGWIEYAARPNESLSIGEYVQNFAAINYRCNENYRIDGATQTLCLSGEFSHPVRDCEAFCEPRIINTFALQATYCRLNGQTVPCSDPARVGTTADVNCQHRYEKSGQAVQKVTCNQYGQWQPIPQPCTPICGEEAPDGVAFIVGGHETEITKAPWHAAIYLQRQSRFDVICGGTILNTRVILSAMHCFWDRIENRPNDVTLFRVAVGKSLADYTAVEVRRPQFMTVKDIHFPVEYRDLDNNYEADIAVLILSENIVFQAHIAPICIPYGLRYNEIIVPDGWKGRVAGFGLTSASGSISPVIKIVELPVVSHERCVIESGGDALLTRDKFCAGFVNLDVSVCEGDSGGGLVFPQTENGKTKYYIRGTVSTGHNKDGSCDSNRYTTFTNILYHEKLIETYEVENRPK